MRYSWLVLAGALALPAAGVHADETSSPSSPPPPAAPSAASRGAASSADARVAAAWAAYVRGDHAAALKILKPLAEAGNADAEYDLGTMYSDGHGVPRDPRQAEAWWQKAAAQGQADAQFSLGFLLLYGGGEGPNAVNADPDAGLPWLQKAAAQGHVSADYFLGYLYWSGTIVPFDAQKALQYTMPAANAGRADAQYQAGMILSRQPGAQNAIEAYKWLDLAARQHYPGAEESRDRLAANRLAPAEVQQAKAMADSWKPAARGGKS
jgi:TPR repeat protein